MIPSSWKAAVLAILTLSYFSSALGKGEMQSNLRKAAGAGGGSESNRLLQTEQCPPGEMLYYDAFFTLHDDNGVAENCSEEDEAQFGPTIRDIVAHVDSTFPQYNPGLGLSAIETTVCIFPSFPNVELADTDEQQGRNLANKKKVAKKKKRWTFKSGGSCSRCKKNRNRRFLPGKGPSGKGPSGKGPSGKGPSGKGPDGKDGTDVPSLARNFWDDGEEESVAADVGEEEDEKDKDKDEKKEDGKKGKKGEAELAAKEACDLAELAQFAYSIGKKGLDTIQMYIDEIADMSAFLDNDRNALEKGEEVEEIAADALEILRAASEEAQQATLACVEAQESALIPDEQKAKKGAKKAKDASDKVKQDVEIIHMDHSLAKLAKKEVVEDVVKKKQKDRNDNYKAVIDEKKDELKELGQAENEEKKEMQELLKDKDLDLEKEEVDEIKEELKLLKEVGKDDLHDAKDELKAWTEEIKDEVKYLDQLDEYIFAMQFAENLEEWMKVYMETLETTIHYEIFKKKKGKFKIDCLKSDEKDHFDVIVAMSQKRTIDSTNIAECE